METTLSSDAKKKLQEIISAGDELLATAKEMPLESQPLKQFSAGHPTHIYFQRLLTAAVRLAPMLLLQPPFQIFFDEQGQIPNRQIFPNDDEAQAGVDWLTIHFDSLLFQYGLRTSSLKDFENPEEFKAGLFPRDARENLIWQNDSCLGGGGPLLPDGLMVEALGAGGGYEFPFPMLNDSTIKALEESIEFLRGLVPTNDDDGGDEEKVALKVDQHNDSPWHAPDEEPPVDFEWNLAGNLAQLTNWTCNSSDPRKLERLLNRESGNYFGKKIKPQLREVWFRDKMTYAEANSNKLKDEERAKSA